MPERGGFEWRMKKINEFLRGITDEFTKSIASGRGQAIRVMTEQYMQELEVTMITKDCG
jgi:hypothetical protein